jgi:hypothetical protein
MKLSFEPGLPYVAAELVSADSKTLQRLMVGPGVDVELRDDSPGSYLRLFMPSGDILSLPIPERSNWNVKFEDLDPSVTTTRSVFLLGEATAPPTIGVLEASVSFDPQRNSSHIIARRNDADRRLDIHLRCDGRIAMPPTIRQAGEGLLLQLNTSSHHEGFSANFFDTSRAFTIRLPSNLSSIRILVPRGEDDPIKIIPEAKEPIVDTILGYLQRGDLHGADSMSKWSQDRAESLLEGKVQDPFSAAVGAYHLLRLGQLELLRDWPRNLANWFEFLPDGCVIWACQLMRQDPDDRQEIKRYLLESIRRGLPFYTEGFRLLIESLPLLRDEEADAALKGIINQGSALWDSPISTVVQRSSSLCSPVSVQFAN